MGGGGGGKKKNILLQKKKIQKKKKKKNKKGGGGGGGGLQKSSVRPQFWMPLDIYVFYYPLRQPNCLPHSSTKTLSNLEYIDCNFNRHGN